VIILLGMEITWENTGNMGECPKCGGTDMSIILYGLPSEELLHSKKVKEKKIILGGCCVGEDNPKQECNDCGWRY
jgi:hypothetical protein